MNRFFSSFLYRFIVNKVMVVSKTPLFLCIGLLSLYSFSAKNNRKAEQNAVYEDIPLVEAKIHPELIRPQADGSLILRAKFARAIGPDIEYMPKWQAYGWFTSSSRVEWDVKVRKSGDYEVFLEWSVSDEEAGKPFVFITNNHKLTGTVSPTGSWQTYKTKKVGQIYLSKGIQEMILKPGSEFEPGGALLDLRGVWLIPVK